MYKIFIILCLFLSGCFLENHNVYGTIYQNSMSWHSKNVCDSSASVGYCIKVADGPITITDIKSNSCSVSVMIGVLNHREHESSWPFWSIKSEVYEEIDLQDINLKIENGESLYIWSNGENVDDSCYIHWKGQK